MFGGIVGIEWLSKQPVLVDGDKEGVGLFYDQYLIWFHRRTKRVVEGPTVFNVSSKLSGVPGACVMFHWT